MLKNILISVFLLILACQHKVDSVIYVSTSEVILDSLLQNKNNSIISVAQQFLGEPYKSHALELSGEERLVVDLTGFDCVTYVETVLALYKSKGDKNRYLKTLTDLRYRKGIVDGYISRLHYFSEWIYQGEQNNFFENISLALNGTPYLPSVSFMSEHPHLYNKLEAGKLVDSIKKVEEKVSDLHLAYLPKDDVKKIEPLLKNGDIIAITTNIKGLDISHVGFVCTENGSANFVHASSDSNKIICSMASISEYLGKHKHMTGAMVLRLKYDN